MKKFINNDLFLTSITFLSLSFYACDQKETKTSEGSAEIGKPFLGWVNEEDIQSIQLEKNFAGETPFSIKLKKQPEQSFEKKWLIDEPHSSSLPLKDSLADNTFIRHLLSTLKTLTPLETLENNQPERFGLKPARAIFTFTFSNHSPIQLTLGDEVRSGVRYGKTHPNALPQIFSGAFIRMTELIINEVSLREKKILLRPIDDFDLLILKEVKTQKQSLELTLEREGAQFKVMTSSIHQKKPQTDKNLIEKKQKINSLMADEIKINQLIERLFHFKIKSFETPKDPLSLKSIYTLSLFDRKNKETKLEILSQEEKLFLKTSERENILFETYPELLTVLKDFQKQAK